MNVIENAVVILPRNGKLAVFEADFTLLSGEGGPIEAAYHKTSIRFCENASLARREAKRLAAEIKARVQLRNGILDYSDVEPGSAPKVITSNMSLKRGRKKRK